MARPLPVTLYLLAGLIVPIVLIALYSVHLLTNLVFPPAKFDARHVEGLPAVPARRHVGVLRPLQDLDGDHADRVDGRGARRLPARLLPGVRRPPAPLHAPAPAARAVLRELSAPRLRVDGDALVRRDDQLDPRRAGPGQGASRWSGSTTRSSRSASSSRTRGSRSSPCRSSSFSRTSTSESSRPPRTSARTGS